MVVLQMRVLVRRCRLPRVLQGASLLLQVNAQLQLARAAAEAAAAEALAVVVLLRVRARLEHLPL